MFLFLRKIFKVLKLWIKTEKKIGNHVSSLTATAPNEYMRKKHISSHPIVGCDINPFLPVLEQ